MEQQELTHTYSRKVNWYKGFGKPFGLPGKAEPAHFLPPSNSPSTHLGEGEGLAHVQ